MEALVYIAIGAVFVIGLVAGGVIVFFFRRIALLRQLRNAQRRAARMVGEARDEASGILATAKEEIERNRTKSESELRELIADERVRIATSNSFQPSTSPADSEMSRR